MENTAYTALKDFVREHHGFSGSDFEEHPGIYKLYQDTMNNIRQFTDKKVKLYYSAQNDFMGVKGEKIGKIKIDGEKIKFYEGRKRTRFYYLDAGFFEGFFATLIPLKIEEI